MALLFYSRHTLFTIWREIYPGIMTAPENGLEGIR